METANGPDIFDEAALVDLARQGDDTAFTTLVSRYDRKIFRLAKNITQNDEDAEDVLQDAFLKAYTHLDRFHATRNFTPGSSASPSTKPS